MATEEEDSVASVRIHLKWTALIIEVHLASDLEQRGQTLVVVLVPDVNPCSHPS